MICWGPRSGGNLIGCRPEVKMNHLNDRHATTPPAVHIVVWFQSCSVVLLKQAASDATLHPLHFWLVTLQVLAISQRLHTILTALLSCYLKYSMATGLVRQITEVFECGNHITHPCKAV